MRKEPTFCDATTGFSAKWRLGNKRRSSILTSHLIGNAAWELCFNQSEVLPSSRKCHFISMEFLRSFLRRREMLAVSQSNCGIKVILMLVWLCYNCFFFLLKGCIQWLSDITMFTQSPQRMCHRYDTKRHVSLHVYLLTHFLLQIS